MTPCLFVVEPGRHEPESLFELCVLLRRVFGVDDQLVAQNDGLLVLQLGLPLGQPGTAITLEYPLHVFVDVLLE